MTSPSPSTDQAGCVHHWALPAPNGPISPGVCKRCGAEREFRTTDDETVRADGTVVSKEQHARAVQRANAARRALATH